LKNLKVKETILNPIITSSAQHLAHGESKDIVCLESGRDVEPKVVEAANMYRVFHPDMSISISAE
jgi:hypothetical protein